MTHVCHVNGYDHPVPSELPEKLQGPEVGQVVRYKPKNMDYEKLVSPNHLVRIKERSYVWSPGECNSRGGHRRYDWKVIEWPIFHRDGTVNFSSMVVDDKDLEVLK